MNRPLFLSFMAGAKNILVINGPNLNLLGARETRHYGRDTLRAINLRLSRRAREGKARLATYQSNSESELVERIQQARREGVDFIIINPAAYTHTSVALRDALAAVGIPFVEDARHRNIKVTLVGIDLTHAQAGGGH